MILGLIKLELLSGNHFTVLSHCDLDLWPSDLKIIRVICESWSMYLWSFMIVAISVLELPSGNHFTISGHCDLDLWPSDLKINTGHLRVMINLPIKFHDPRPKRSWVIIRKPSGGRTDGRTDRPTDMCKTIYPSSSKVGGGHKNNLIIEI